MIAKIFLQEYFLISPPQAGGRWRQHTKLATEWWKTSLETALVKRSAIYDWERTYRVVKVPATTFSRKKMIVQLDVFCTSMKHGIDSHMKCTSVITEENWWGVRGETKVMQKISEPGEFSSNRGHGVIFSFSTRSGEF